ncbi:HTTM domain-containing protein [Humidisolicoccus flavus]|uniref:HTTM domain-containing protein n=1 Tax=Humidisolicoccus flavus TaxID=3111414 RepID=UPI00324BFCAE
MTNPEETPLPRGLVALGEMIASGVAKTIGSAIQLCRTIDNWLLDSKHASFGIAVTRILLGLTALGLLLTNFNTRLYSFGSGAAWNGEMAEPVSSFPQIWLFSAFHAVLGNDVLFTLMYIGLMVLAALVVLGWRFKFVIPVFFVMWVSFIEVNDMLGDQGDNMFRIAILFLFFTDAAAHWSLDARRRRKHELFAVGGSANQIGTLFHNLALVALTAQVIFVYTSGALFKAGGAPWREGRAVYDPLQTARFGTWPALSDFVTAWGPAVAIFTLGSIFIQAAFPFLLLHRTTRIIGLFGILAFHVGIAVLMGLPWFSLTMVAIDSIFVRDRSWKKLASCVRRVVQPGAGSASEAGPSTSAVSDSTAAKPQPGAAEDLPTTSSTPAVSK